MSSTQPGERRRWILLAGLVVLPAIGLVVVAWLAGLGAETVTFEVPRGTAARLAAGEAVVVLPSQLELSVGDTLEIHNHDDEAHEVGPYVVAAGQTLRQTFLSPGTVQGICTLHPEGSITILVR